MPNASPGPVLTACAALCLLLTGTVAGAQSGTGVSSTSGTTHGDWAKVISVTPLHRNVAVSTPHEECWDEPVRRYYAGSHGHHGYYSYTPTIVGSIIGGVIGNQFGSGRGKTAVTAAGAVLGGSLGRDAYHHRRHHHGGSGHYTTTYERRCETVYTTREERRADGYLVDYEYNGRTYTTRTSAHPGKRLRVSVSVVPQG